MGTLVHSIKLGLTALATAIVLLVQVPSAWAGVTSSRSVFAAVDTLVEYLLNDIEEMDIPMDRTAISVIVTDKLDEDLKAYVLRILSDRMEDLEKAEIVPCFQCETIKGHSDGNRIIIEKGIATQRTMEAIARELSLNTFFEVHLGYTGRAIYLQARAIDTKNYDISWTETYRLATRFLSDRSFLFGLEIGPALVSTAERTEGEVAIGIAALFAERFYGFGKLGLAFSTVLSFTNLKFNQSTGPYFAFNLNEMLGYYTNWGDVSLFINPGYGVSDKNINFVMRGGGLLEIGSFTHITLEVQHPLYSQLASKAYATSFVFSLGFDLY